MDNTEKQAIKQQLKTLSAEKADVDKETTSITNNTDLTGTPKTNLTSAYNDYLSKYNALVTAINNILNATLVTLTLRESYDTAYTNHNNALATLKQRHIEAINAIAETKKQTSITTSKNYTDAQLTTTVDAIRGTVSQLREDFEGLEIGGVNLLKNSEFITTAEWTIPYGNVSVDTSNKCFDSNSMKIAVSGLTDVEYTEFNQTFITNVVSGQKYTVSGYYYVDNASLLDGVFRINLKGKLPYYPVYLEEITFSKTECKVKQWTKFSFTVTLNQDYENLSLACLLDKNGTVWFSRLQVEEGSIATTYSPASSAYATKSEMELNNEHFKLTFQATGSGNLLKNSDCQFGLNGQWVSNGGGIDIVFANDEPFHGNREPCYKTSFPNGIKYTEIVRLKPNTDYVYQAYIYVDSDIYTTTFTPMHFWSWEDIIGAEPFPSQRVITVVDYKQDLVAGEFSLCYIHFKTNDIGSPIGFSPFILNDYGYASRVLVKQICLKEGKTPSVWVPHNSEIWEGITEINEDGIKISHTNIDTKTMMTADGFYFVDENDDIFASLSSKNTWASLRVQEVFANNIENVYTGATSLHVDHSMSTSGDGSYSNPFNSFGVLKEYLERMPIINKDLTIHVYYPYFEINEELSLENLRGSGYLNIIFEKNCVLRSNGWAIRLKGLNKQVSIDGGRSSYSASDGAVILDKGSNHGIFVSDCQSVYIHSININCKNWGIKAERSRLRTRSIDFGRTYCALELTENSWGYEADSCGNCTNFTVVTTGSVLVYGASSGGIRPCGNKVETSGKVMLVGNERTQKGSYKYPTSSSTPSVPSTATYTQTFKATGFGTYQYAWSNWGNGQAGGCIQGNWQNYGNKAGHVFFNLSSIRSFLGSGTVGGCTITITRRNGGGYSGATNIYINASRVTGASGTPAYSYNSLLGQLSWGETKTFNLSRNIVNLLKSSAGSIAFYSSSDTSAYAEIVACSITLQVTK